MEWVKERMHQARLQRNRIQVQGTVAVKGDDLERETAESGARFPESLVLGHRLYWLAGGMALGGVVVIMVWMSGLVELSSDSGTVVFSDDKTEQYRIPVELPSRIAADDAEGMRKDIRYLTEQMQKLTSTVSDLENELLRIQPASDSIASLDNEPASSASRQGVVPGIEVQLEKFPSTAAGAADVGASGGRDNDKLEGADSTPLVTAKQLIPPASAIQAQETTLKTAPWVINLASLQRKADAERFMKNAESRGVATDLYQVTVTGKKYWRVYVPGFDSAAEAKAEASSLKEKLGLKDAWVAKR